uniref:thioredoxin family protein n=1 Tax=Altererythrobacter segetis TaxID=1104773 RepID=UPI0014091A48|nr:thioredoxin family protein [Altererythrobacter segetis]
MTRTLPATLAMALALAFATTGCKPAAERPAATAAGKEIAWREGDVADALAEAKESGKPALLYWGAVWCPPCNQMKSTLFKDPAFIAETQAFVPVYLDGDSKGAQRWGEQFGISGYPTVIVLRPDGSEITRVSSATMASQLPALLRTAAGRTTSIEDLLARAKADPARLATDDWRILSDFDWRNDPKHFKDPASAVPLLERLAAAAPQPSLQRRFALLALVVGAEQGEDGKARLTAAQQARLLEILPPILADAAEVKANRQELSYDVAPMVAALSDGKRREGLSRALIAAADSLYADPSASIADRLNATNADVKLARASGKVPAGVLAKVRDSVAWADANARDKMTRQGVIDDAAYLLFNAGDHTAARKLELAELKRSEQPYYYMSSLSDFAEQDGDKAGAIEWARKAYEASQGPATRVQWAILYSRTVLRNAPDDKAAVTKAANAVIDELGKSPDSYYQRTRVKVADWGDKLRSWSAAHNGGQVLAGLRSRMDEVCGEQGTQAAACRQWTA